MKNNKAFTLIELLGVIIILALLALITGRTLTKITANSKKELNDIQLNSIKYAAEELVQDNLNKLPDVNSCKYIKLATLKDNGLLDDDIKDIVTKENIDNIYVKVCTYQNNINSELYYECEVVEADDVTNLDEFMEE